jgi:hypothetical protein
MKDAYDKDTDSGELGTYPLKPEWLNKEEVDKCKRECIPMRILRIKHKDGRERIAMQKKNWIL